jgi:hypothetical protein
LADSSVSPRRQAEVSPARPAPGARLAVKDSTVLDNLAAPGADIYNLGALTLDDSIVGVFGP